MKAKPEWTEADVAQSNSARAQLIAFGRWREAVRLARIALRRDPDPVRSAIDAGGTLIDAGSEMGNRRLIVEAVRRIEGVIADVPKHGKHAAHYNLANGYSLLGARERGFGPTTKPSVARAISHFDEALTHRDSAKGRTNLANALCSHGRYVEALDEYNQVLRERPEFSQALGNRAVVLMEIRRWLHPHEGLLHVAHQDASEAMRCASGDSGLRDRLQDVCESLKAWDAGGLPAAEKTTRVINWIWSSGLNLNLCPWCRAETPDAFDTYALPGVLTGVGRRPPIPVVYDLVNSLHRSYSTARWLLAQGCGIAGRLPADHVVTQKGSEDAQHDLRGGLLLQAASAFFGVLHQVAASTNAYFRLGYKPPRIDLEKIWWQHGTKRAVLARLRMPEKRDQLHPRFRKRPSRMLCALFRLSRSLLRDGGRYWHLRQLRNSIQHGVIVVGGASTSGRYLETISAEQLRTNAIQLGRIAKAALLYFGGAVWKAEHERVERVERKGGRVVPGHSRAVVRS